MVKVMFVYFDLYAGYVGFNHGIAYINGMLKHHGHDTQLIHIMDVVEFSAAHEKIHRYKPDIIALSFTTNQKQYVRKFFDFGKLPKSLIIAGGVHSSSVKEQLFKEFPEINALCLGEGEEPMDILCEKIEKNEDYYATPSFLFNGGEGIISNPVAPLRDIEEFPMPDYSLFDVPKVVKAMHGGFQMLISRGCPYNCHYCWNHLLRNIYPNKQKFVRFLPVEQAIRTIKNNLLLYPETKEIILVDDMLTMDKKWLFDFCKQYKEEIGLPWSCNARVETITEEIVKHLSHAGCYMIEYGVESGNTWIRKHILNRGHPNEVLKRTFALTQKYGIRAHAFSIFGLPFETKKMAEETLKLNYELRPDSGRAFYFYPYPNTENYVACEKYGLIDGKRYNEVSGYLEQPVLKEIHMTHKDIRKYVDTLQIYLYAREIFFRRCNLLPLEKIFIACLPLIRAPIGALLRSKNQFIVNVRWAIGHYVYKIYNHLDKGITFLGIIQKRYST